MAYNYCRCWFWSHNMHCILKSCQTDRIDCCVIIRRLGMRLKVQSYGIAVNYFFNDNNNCMQPAEKWLSTNQHSLCFMPALDSGSDELYQDIKTRRHRASASYTHHIVCLFVVHARSCSLLLLPVSNVGLGLTVKLFIEIMKCQIFNCRLCQTALSFTFTVSTAVYIVINVILQNAFFKCRLQDSIMNRMYVNHKFTITVIIMIFAMCHAFRRLPWFYVTAVIITKSCTIST